MIESSVPQLNETNPRPDLCSLYNQTPHFIESAPNDRVFSPLSIKLASTHACNRRTPAEWTETWNQWPAKPVCRPQTGFWEYELGSGIITNPILLVLNFQLGDRKFLIAEFRAYIYQKVEKAHSNDPLVLYEENEIKFNTNTPLELKIFTKKSEPHFLRPITTTPVHIFWIKNILSQTLVFNRVASSR